MEYREFGKTGLKLSAIGFGGMRLPRDTDAAARMVRRAVALGMNYFETAPEYCGGTSEVSIGKGLKGIRDSVYISTKSSSRSADGLRRDFERSLKKMGVERFDFYHVWCLQRADEVRKVLGKGGALQGLRKLQREGLVDHVGFTSHQPPDEIIRVIGTKEFECVTVSYNLLTRECAKIIPAAVRHGLGMVVMKPLSGGTLATQSDKLRALTRSHTSTEVALRFLLAHKELGTIIPGVSGIEQVEMDARLGGMTDPLSETESRCIERILDEFRYLEEEFCTWCNYCMPCPEGVNIPFILDCRKKVQVYRLLHWARGQYQSLPPEERADRCVECGECEPKCPNQLPIAEQLKEAHGKFSV